MNNKIYDTNIIIGFDFGLKYIGVAVGQKISMTASPLCSIPAKDGIPPWDIIEEIITSWNPFQLVVGLPINLDGSKQHITFCAQNFANRLHNKFKIPVSTTDEAFSTWEARNKISLSKHSKKNKQELEKLNATAAAIITEQWLVDNY